MEDQEIRPPLTISEAARKLNCSDQAARNALLRGELEGFRIGRSWRIKPESVDRKLAGDQ
jgi:excisionase family DNA binding protein